MEKTEKTSIAACQQKGISLVALWYERYLASPFAKTLLFSSIAFTQICEDREDLLVLFLVELLLEEARGRFPLGR